MVSPHLNKATVNNNSNGELLLHNRAIINLPPKAISSSHPMVRHLHTINGDHPLPNKVMAVHHHHNSTTTHHHLRITPTSRLPSKASNLLRSSGVHLLPNKTSNLAHRPLTNMAPLHKRNISPLLPPPWAMTQTNSKRIACQ